MALTRDIPFCNYSSNSNINVTLNYLNSPVILDVLKDYLHYGLITQKSVFRGVSENQLVGPYISQFLYLNVPLGSNILTQQYYVYPSKELALSSNSRIEWGVSANETISLQNGNLDSLPQVVSTELQKRYIYSGRALAEIVHNDPPYQFYYQAALILISLGVSPNPGFPSFSNQSAFITNSGSAQILTALGEVTNSALKHAWYWKWQVYRRVRPEVYSLWIHNIKKEIVANENNFDIDNIVLNSRVLNDIRIYNEQWGTPSSYTLPLTYREGSPVSPSYPSSHAVIAGACCTLLKIFFDTEKSWTSLSKLNKLSTVESLVVQSSEDGSCLTPYLEKDISEMTIVGEINKLAFNISFGRNWAGIHYRSDIIEGIKLGEKIAVDYMKDILTISAENNSSNMLPIITFRNFNNKMVTVSSFFNKN
jgi:hypothetical protein